jgi:RimJ/RimL family protein N-acetyltransferase
VPALTYRTATLEDAALASDLMSAAYPEMAHDPVLLRYRWATPRKGFAFGRYIAEMERRPIAFLGWVHGPWEEIADRHCEVEVWLDLAQLDHDLLTRMWSWIADEAVEQGTRLLLAYCAEDEPEMLGALSTLGFHRERVERVWELDLEAHGARLVTEAAHARRTASDERIELTTLNAWQDPHALRKLYELDALTRQDIPTSLPIFREAFEDFVRRTDSPDRRPDRSWIALDGDRPVAYSYLKFPPVRGTVWTGYTCSHPAYRGRGLATAVKLQSLAQAVRLGVPAVRTDNDSENAPMLHINERLGYVPRPGFVEHHKRVKKA